MSPIAILNLVRATLEDLNLVAILNLVLVILVQGRTYTPGSLNLVNREIINPILNLVLVILVQGWT